MRPPRYYDQDFMAHGGRINGVPLYFDWLTLVSSLFGS